MKKKLGPFSGQIVGAGREPGGTRWPGGSSVIDLLQVCGVDASVLAVPFLPPLSFETS